MCLIVQGFLSPAAAQIDDLVHARVAMQQSGTQTAGKRATHSFSATLTPDTAFLAEYNGLVLSGTATGDFEAGYVRFLENGAWSTWHPLEYLQTSTPAFFMAGYRSDIYRPGTPFELRFDTAPDQQIDIFEAGVFSNRRDEDHALPPNIRNEAAPRLPDSPATIRPPTLIPRGAWGAESFVGTPVPLARPTYNRMTLHHAACCAASTYEEGLVQVKAIQDFHQDVRGWSDIGYHFLFDQSGRVYQGRPFLDNRINLASPPQLAMGAHVGGANTGNIGVSLLGCYHPPEGSNCVDEMSPALRDSVVTLYAYLSERYGVTTPNLLGHRDQTATSCPGDNNYVLLPALRTEIDELILTGNAPIAFASLTADRSEDGVIQLSWAFTEIIDVAAYRIDRESEAEVVTVYESVTLDEAGATVDAGVAGEETVQYALYAISSEGVEQRLALAMAQLEAPNEIVLGQNFPNPFSARSTIRYYVDQEGIVRINVYDISGRQVRALVNTYQEGDQWYTVEFDAGTLAQGMYYYRMQVEGFASIVFDETRAMLYVR